MQFGQLKRREFITLIGGAASWPIAARAQQTMPVIGLLHAASLEPYRNRIDDLRKGLAETGFVEGRNLKIDYRWAEGQLERIPALVADLVRQQVTIIAPAGAAATVRAAMEATRTIPIVFSTGADPVKLGFVASLNRPGGNVTGVTFLANDLEEKQLQVLHELVPSAKSLGFVINPKNENSENAAQHARTAAERLGRQLHVLHASNGNDYEAVFADLASRSIGGVLFYIDPLFMIDRDKIAALAIRYAVPAVYGLREFAAAGGLMSYGASLSDTYRQHGVYIGRILNGAKPADLPVLQPIKFEFVLNLKTAKVLGLEIPTKLLSLADEVIE